MTRLHLRQLDGSLQFTVSAERLLLGRSAGCDLVVPSPSVSRRHAEVWVDGEALRLRDLGSANGITVNGERLTQGSATLNDLVEFGAIAFRVADASDRSEGGLEEDIPDGLSLRSLPTLLPAEDDARNAETLRRLLEVAADLSGPVPLEQVCGAVADLVFTQVDADRVVVLLLEAGDAPLPVAWRNRAGEGAPRVPRIIADRALADRRPVLTESAQDDDRFQSRSVKAAAVRSALCVPLLDGSERPLGILYADTITREHPFDEKDAKALLAFGGLAAAAIGRARFAADVERERELRAGFERFFAPSVAEMIVASGGSTALTGSQVPVAVVFGDLRGFTALSESYSPEATAALLGEYFAIVGEIVFEQDGTLDKFIGDGFLAVWGAPVACSDAADRALAAARAIGREVSLLGAAAGGERISAGFGLSYGEVFAGNVGSSRRVEYTVVGDAVNVASRLCEAAAPQEILLTAAFANQLTTMTGLVRLPDRPVRGRVQPVAVFSASLLAPAQSGTDDRPEP